MDEQGIRIRMDHYYGGSLYLRLDPEDQQGWYFELTWEAYQGGGATLKLDRDELQALIEGGVVLLEQQAEKFPWVRDR